MPMFETDFSNLDVRAPGECCLLLRLLRFLLGFFLFLQVQRQTYRVFAHVLSMRFKRERCGHHDEGKEGKCEENVA